MNIYWLCAAVIGACVGFYWARVLKLVVKTRRKTGQSAQLVPREPLGRALRIIWYPTVGAWAVLPWIAAYGQFGRIPSACRPLWTSPWTALPGAVIAVSALLATLVCWQKMGTSWRMGINPGEKTQLVVNGPWAYVAHPIYALSSAMMLGSVLTVSSPLMFVAAVIHLLFLQWEARREEQHLISVHGDVYANYFRRVGRFVPRSLRPSSS